MTRLDVGDGSGFLRLTLRPETERTATLVHVGAHGIADGPLFNNARELLAFASAFTAACAEMAWHLPIGPETDEERADRSPTLFDPQETASA